MTETVQGTYCVDPATLQTLNQVGRAQGRAEAMPLQVGAVSALPPAPAHSTQLTIPAMHACSTNTVRLLPPCVAWGLQVKYQDKIKGDLTTAHPQPMPNGDLVNLVSTVG